MFFKYLIIISIIFLTNSFDPFENLNYKLYYKKVINNIKNKEESKLWSNLSKLGTIHLFGLSNQEVNIPLAYTYFSISSKKGDGDGMFYKSFIMKLNLDPLSRKHFRFYKKIPAWYKKKKSILNNIIEIDTEFFSQVEKLFPLKRDDILRQINELTDKKIIIKEEPTKKKDNTKKEGKKKSSKKIKKKKKLTKSEKENLSYNKKIQKQLSLYKQLRKSTIKKLFYQSSLKNNLFAQFRIGNNQLQSSNCFNSITYLLNGFRILFKNPNPEKTYMKNQKISLEENLIPSKKNSFENMLNLIEENEVYNSEFKKKRDVKYNSLKTRM